MVFTEKGITLILGGILAYIAIYILRRYGQVRKDREKIAKMLPIIFVVLGLIMLMYGFYVNAAIMQLP